MANMQRIQDRSEFIRRRGPPGPNEVFQFRFLIPAKAASVIIGTSGERIQRLMEECNSRLSILDSKGPERVFMIEGSMEGCIKVWADCFPDLKDIMGSESRKTGDEMDLRFLCHNSIVGSIIGKAGSRVKELRATFTLSLIKVHQELAPKSTDRVIQIVGEPNKIFECFKVMYAELESQNIRGHVENYNAENCNEQLIMTYGGWPSEPGRRHGGPSLMGDGSKLLSSYGASRNTGAPAIDQYGGARNTVPPMNQYGGTRNSAPANDQFGAVLDDQYGGPRNGAPPVDLYGLGRNAPPPMNQYGGEIDAPAHVDQHSMDNYGGGRNAPMDKYGAGRNAPPSMDKYGGGRNGPAPSMDQYGGVRNAPFPMDKYGGGRNCAMDQYGEERNAESSMDPYGGGRNNFQSMDRGGMGRKVVPLMDHFASGNDFDSQDDYYGASNRPPFEDDRAGTDSRGRRPYLDDRQMAMKRPRVWNNDKSPYDDASSRNNLASSPNKFGPGNVDVSLPASCLSALQGAGGEKLSNIMKDSGADIVVKPEDGGAEVRILTLKGTKDQIEGAQYLMQMCMKRYMLNL